MRSWFLLSTLLAIGVLSSSLGDEPRQTGTDFAYIKVFTTAVGRRTEMILWEGLPHPKAEKELLADELKTKRTIALDGQTYYSERLALTQQDADRLGRLLAKAESFAPWRGGKFCGGYHADYAIEWHVGEEVYRAHVCLGCQEIKLFTTGTELYCDIAEEVQAQLGANLAKYRRNRPAPD
jgi:hypothetical protein